jgi:transmembrane sensor
MNSSFNHIDPELLVRFLSGEANAQERQTVNHWLDADVKNKTYFKELSTIWNASASSGTFRTDWVKEDWNKVRQRIDDVRTKETNKPAKQRSLVYTLTRIAASVIFCIGIYFVLQHLDTGVTVKEVIAVDGVKTLNLPDGSKVYLNSSAKLTYPEIFDTEAREVTLDGEAFFEIFRDAQKPFLIKTRNLTTEVVGTSFNIKSDINSIVVTVVTGKVKLYEDRYSSIAMTAGEQGSYSANVLKRKVNDDLNFMSWKSNTLIFKSTPLSRVIHDLNRHYGKRIKLASDNLTKCTLTSLYQNQTLEEILQELSVVFSIEIEEINGEIIIKGKGC